MKKNFVAINYISCEDSYKERFEELFGSRIKAIDVMPGFIDMYVLKPSKDEDAYLVISHWESESQFKEWTKSPNFLEGHKRAFSDLAEYKKEGKTAPMQSDFKTYNIIAE